MAGVFGQGASGIGTVGAHAEGTSFALGPNTCAKDKSIVIGNNLCSDECSICIGDSSITCIKIGCIDFSNF